jgi:sugar lactone lactonase YvrE
MMANFFIYRGDTAVPFDTGIRVTQSRNLDFRGLHVYSPGKLSFDNTLVDQTFGVQVRAREIAWLHVSDRAPASVAEPDTRVARVAGGFTNIDGLAAAANGDVCFVDQAWSRVYRWSAEHGLSLVTDAIPQPVALAFDQANDMLVVSRGGHVYALPPGGDVEDIMVLEPGSAAPPATATAWLPTNRWRDGHDWIEANTRLEPLRYLAPDGSIFIPAPGALAALAKPGWHRGTVDLARTYALAPAQTGKPFYVSDEFSQKTWRFSVQPDGTLTEPRLFAEEGEAGTAVDADGNVYVCAGQIFVFDQTGALLDVIEVPERPSAVAFGGADRQTLFIAARTSLYFLPPKAPGL